VITAPLSRGSLGFSRASLEDAVKANIQATVEQIKSRSTLLSEAIQSKSASLASAYFDIDLGTVELLR
jgi:carbonic anhydrase